MLYTDLRQFMLADIWTFYRVLLIKVLFIW